MNATQTEGREEEQARPQALEYAVLTMGKDERTWNRMEAGRKVPMVGDLEEILNLFALMHYRVVTHAMTVNREGAFDETVILERPRRSVAPAGGGTGAQDIEGDTFDWGTEGGGHTAGGSGFHANYIAPTGDLW